MHARGAPAHLPQSNLHKRGKANLHACMRACVHARAACDLVRTSTVPDPLPPPTTSTHPSPPHSNPTHPTNPTPTHPPAPQPTPPHSTLPTQSTLPRNTPSRIASPAPSSMTLPPTHKRHGGGICVSNWIRTSQWHASCGTQWHRRRRPLSRSRHAGQSGSARR